MKNENKRMADIRHSVSQKAQAAQHTSQTKSAQQIVSRNAVVTKNLVRKPIKNMDVARSGSISHFTPQPRPVAPLGSIKRVQEMIKKPMQKMAAEIKPVPHPLVQNIQQKPIVETSAKTIKETAIAEAFEKIAQRQKQEKEAIKKRNKMVQIILAIVVIFAIAIYFLLINLPYISVSLANAKSGVEASFPSFCPEGFNRKGLAYTNGNDVVIDFKASSNDSVFSLKQSKSSWDSSAVKNMVEEASSGKFLTTEESGLTIFTYDGSAAWVNGGILYTISGNAELNIGDIRQIALSL